MTTVCTLITACARNSISTSSFMCANTTVTLAAFISCDSMRKQLRAAVASTPIAEVKSSTYTVAYRVAIDDGMDVM